MILRPIVSGLAVFLVATPVLAAADVRVQITAPAPALVYDATHYSIPVRNIGNKTANSVVLTVTLPATHTSPTVHVMGTLGNVDPRCAPSGTQLICTLGAIAKNVTKTVTFDLELPQADEVLQVSAAATSTSAENSLANNAATDVPTLLNYAVVVSEGDVAHADHCTGQNLTSFFECTLYPSSIAGFDLEFLAGGAIGIVDAPATYGGTWTQTPPGSQQTDPEYLGFTITEDGEPVATFEGWGTAPMCFEGMTLFPGSTWVAPYEVCL